MTRAPRRARRPAPLSLGSYTVRAMGSEADTDGRWLWRIEWYPAGGAGAQRTRGLGRHRPGDVEAAAHAAIAGLDQAAPVSRARVSTWGVLLRAALAAWRREGAAGGRPALRTLGIYATCVGYLLYVAESWPLPTSPRALTAQAVELRDRLIRRPGTTEGLAPSTTQLTLRIAGMAWGWGVREELVQPLPWSHPRLSVARPRRHISTREEAARVLAELRRSAPPWIVVAYVVHWATAPRIGELGALTVGDVDLEVGAVWYGRHEGDAKTGERLAVLDPGAAAELGAWLARRRESEVLTAETGLWGVTPGTVRSGWHTIVYAAMDAAGVPRWPAHAVRSAMADDLAGAGVDEHTATAQLGNSESVRRAHYRQALAGPLRAAVADRALVGAPEGAVLRLPRGRRS